MPRIRIGTLRRTNLIVLAFMLWGVPLVQAQDSLEDLQKRKTIADAEIAAIKAETARDEARKKRSELVPPLDPVKKAKVDAGEAANSARVQSLCMQCLEATREELKKCLDAAISREDKSSCLEKQETRASTCDSGECNLERAQSLLEND